MHCTQSSEAKHKIVMHVASARVHHRDVQSTKSAMLRHLCLRNLFEDMKQFDTRPPIPALRTLSFGVRATLCSLPTLDRFTTASFQETFLHREARIARVELLDLLCNKFEIPKSLASYTHLEQLRYHVGQKLIRRDGSVLWATDSNYPSDNKRGKRRRDVLRIQGDEQVDTNTRNALCCEAVVFLNVSLERARFTIPDSVKEEVLDGSVTFVLGRWFTPHDTAVGRDSCNMPTCPGPLYINHCLWQYARARQIRKSMMAPAGVTTAAFLRQAQLFGESHSEQMIAFENEKQAYFGLLFPSNILKRINMCPTFMPNTSKPNYQTWLQTITVV